MRTSSDQYSVRHLLIAVSNELETLACLVDDVQNAIGEAATSWYGKAGPSNSSLMKIQSLDRVSQELRGLKILADAAARQGSAEGIMSTDWIDGILTLTSLRERLVNLHEGRRGEHSKAVFWD